MQDLNWNDLKYVLALHREGALASAARALRVSDTTVARRLAALERVLGEPVFVRNAGGQYQLTALGELVLKRAEAMEREHRALNDALGQAGDALVATVRISAVPIVTNRMLVPALPALHARYPGITVELAPDSRNLDLTKREADLALRFSRPVAGGLRVRAVKLGEIGFGVFGPVGVDDPDALPWITYDDSLNSLPQARWVEKNGGPVAPLRVTDAETALAAVAEGMGRSVLPARVGQRDARLAALAWSGSPLPIRDLWMLSHAEDAAWEAIVAVKAWLSDIAW